MPEAAKSGLACVVAAKDISPLITQITRMVKMLHEHANNRSIPFIPFIPVNTAFSFIYASEFRIPHLSCLILSHACPTAEWDGEVIDIVHVTAIFEPVPPISETFRATEVNKK